MEQEKETEGGGAGRMKATVGRSGDSNIPARLYRLIFSEAMVAVDVELQRAVVRNGDRRCSPSTSRRGGLLKRLQIT